MPRVSVIVPVYNVSCFLERCVCSIARQTFADFEAIFIDDGSTDNSLELCKTLIAPFPNMQVLSKSNGGLTSARLYGLRQAKGQYVVFVDSDDYLADDYIGTLYDQIIANHADVSMCSYYTDNGKDRVARKLYFENEYTVLDSDKVFTEYLLPQIPSINCYAPFLPSFMWLRMFKKELLTENMFVSEREVYQEDLALSLKMYSKLNRVAIINRPLYYYCINQGSLTLRYRENVWQMMCSLYEMINDNLANKNNKEVIEHIKGFLFWAILFSLRNSSLNGMGAYLNNLIHTLKNKHVKCLFLHTNIKNLRGNNLVLFLSYWTFTMPLLYFYYQRCVFWGKLK